MTQKVTLDIMCTVSEKKVVQAYWKANDDECGSSVQLAQEQSDRAVGESWDHRHHLAAHSVRAEIPHPQGKSPPKPSSTALRQQAWKAKTQKNQEKNGNCTVWPILFFKNTAFGAV